MNRRVVIGIIAAIAVVSGLAIAVAWQDNSTGSASQPSDEDRAIDAVIEQIDSGPRSTFQDELLADGQLTETEYDVAFAKYSECVTLAGGILPGGTAKSRWGVYDAGVRVPGLEVGSPNRDALARVLECEMNLVRAAGHGPAAYLPTILDLVGSLKNDSRPNQVKVIAASPCAKRLASSSQAMFR